MSSKKSEQASWWKRLKRFVKANTSLSVIVLAALLLEVTTGVMYYSSHDIVQSLVALMTEREMYALSLSIRNHLAKVEVTLDNMAWVVTDDLAEPDSLFTATRKLVAHNPAIFGSSITCVPYLYPQYGKWFEPYAVRRADGSIESMQIGSATHDYTKSEFFTQPIATGSGYWCEPYLDVDGAKAIVTSYGVPVRDGRGRIVAVVDADLSLDWLEGIMNEDKVFSKTQRFLITGKYNMMAGGDSLLFNRLVDRIKGGEQDYFVLRERHGGKKHVFSAQVGGKTDWMLICVLDDDEVFGRLRSVQFFLLTLVLAGFLLLGFIVWRTSRNLERLRQVNAEKERISSELRVASQIQKSMLPQNHLRLDEVEIVGSLTPAREVGGDLFDYFVRDEKLFFCIGDVSGKGTPSAMLMASTRSLFRAFSVQKNSPAHIMQEINDAASEGNKSNMFVTFFIGVLDLPTGHLRYCNAGHDAPYVMTAGQWAMMEVESNLPICLYSDYKYEEQEAWLKPDSTIFLYTDGLTEAMSAHRQQFGMERIETTLAAHAGQAPDRLLEAMTQAVQGFVGEAEQSDDLTMMAIHYTPQTPDDELSATLTLTNDVSQVAKLTDFQKSVYQQMGLDKKLVRQLQLAVEEAVVNVIDYAYPAGTEGSVEVSMTSDGRRLRVVIVDSGVAFDPTEHEKVDTTLSAEERPIGGLGIYLVRELMDTINYERTDGRNVLTLIKNIV